MPPKKKVSFFRLPPFFYIPLIIGGTSLTAVSPTSMMHCTCCMCNALYVHAVFYCTKSCMYMQVVAFAPHVLPYDSLWHLGTFLHYMAYDLSTLSIAM